MLCMIKAYGFPKSNFLIDIRVGKSNPPRKVKICLSLGDQSGKSLRDISLHESNHDRSQR
jgi:hypothetical protein